MNSSTPSKSSVGIYAIAILGSFLIIAGMVWVLRSYNRPPATDAKRVDERRKAQADVKQASAEQLAGYAFSDKAKGLIRLPVEHAVQLSVEQWKSPAVLRSNLLARLKIATQKPPEKPSEFE